MEALRPSVPLKNSSNCSCAGAGSDLAADLARGHEPAERRAALAHIAGFDAVFCGTVERGVADVGVGDRHAEACAEGAKLVFVQLLLLVGDVLALAGFAEAVALDGPGEDDGRRALVFDGGLEGVVHLHRIVAAEGHLLELVVAQVLDHLEQPRIDAPEMLAEIGAGLDGVLLILAVDDLAHALDEQAVAILGEQRIPLAPPEDLDHVPAGAAERGFELLDDLAVAAHRAVEALQVAVDDEDQVVELLARRQRDGAERFGLVGLAVAEERPDLGLRLRLQPAILEVADEARLVDRHDGAQPHRHAGVVPEVGHQPGMRIRREAAAGFQLAAEVLEMRLVDPPFEVRARVDAGRRVALEEDHVRVAGVVAAEEMIEADFVERRGRGKRRDVAADAFRRLVRAHDHRRGVPADEALDAALDVGAARHERLLVGRNRVDVGSVRGERQLDAVLPGVLRQLAEQAGDLGGTAALQHIINRIEPFACFGRVEIGRVFGGNVSHEVRSFRKCRLAVTRPVGLCLL